MPGRSSASATVEGLGSDGFRWKAYQVVENPIDYAHPGSIQSLRDAGFACRRCGAPVEVIWSGLICFCREHSAALERRIAEHRRAGGRPDRSGTDLSRASRICGGWVRGGTAITAATFFLKCFERKAVPLAFSTSS